MSDLDKDNKPITNTNEILSYKQDEQKLRKQLDEAPVEVPNSSIERKEENTPIAKKNFSDEELDRFIENMSKPIEEDTTSKTR